MVVMDGTRLGSLSLRLDALYCVVAGVFVLLLAPALGPVLGVATWVLVLLGAGAAAWGLLLWQLELRMPPRTVLRTVMAANVAAAVAIALAGATGGTVLLVLSSMVALEVLAFGLSQAVALRRIASASSA